MQDIKECKAFLKAKMDSIMLQLYKENLTLQQILNTATSHEKLVKQSSQHNKTTLTLLLEYGAQEEL